MERFEIQGSTDPVSGKSPSDRMPLTRQQALDYIRLASIWLLLGLSAR
jgi:hypothetical protein